MNRETVPFQFNNYRHQPNTLIQFAICKLTQNVIFLWNDNESIVFDQLHYVDFVGLISEKILKQAIFQLKERQRFFDSLKTDEKKKQYQDYNVNSRLLKFYDINEIRSGSVGGCCIVKCQNRICSFYICCQPDRSKFYFCCKVFE